MKISNCGGRTKRGAAEIHANILDLEDRGHERLLKAELITPKMPFGMYMKITIKMRPYMKTAYSWTPRSN